jgi:DNA mismatch endonuclease, patch repair protein
MRMSRPQTQPGKSIPPMTDVHTPAQRKQNMSAIRGKDTRPERAVRRLLHSMGYRFRLHKANLPGRPDIVLSKHRIAIFVHGCFWHSHDCRFGKVAPATRAEFWAAKRSATVDRDAKKRAELEALGWTIITIWECDTRSDDSLRLQLISSLPPAKVRDEEGYSRIH